MIVRRTVFSICAATLVVVCQCKDKDPPPSHYRDLADDSSGTILVPVSAQWHNPDIATGRADWVPFRKPSELGDEAEEAEEKGTAESDHDSIKEEILELLGDYDDLLAEGDVEELLKYHVASQQAGYRPAAEVGVALRKKLDRIEAALTKQLSEEKSRVGTVMSAIRRGTSLMAVAGVLEVVSDTEVTGRMPAGGLISEVNFKYVDEEWFIELSPIPDVTAMKPMIDMQFAALDSSAQGLEDGAVSGEVVMKQMEAMARMMAGAGAAGGDAPVDKDDESNEEEGDAGGNGD